VFKILLSLLALGLLPPCQADVLYTFDYTALNGPVQSFEFSFTTPTFLTTSSSPAFTPFTVTDGTNHWTMTEDAVAAFPSSSLECFMFGTPPLPPGCGFGVADAGPGQGWFYVLFSGTLSAPGVHGVLVGGTFYTPAGAESISNVFGPNTATGTMSLTIASVPEPEYVGFTALVLPILIGLLVKKKK
jgi:hypothetical protein